MQDDCLEHSWRPGGSYERQGNAADDLRLAAESPKTSELADTLVVLEPMSTSNVCDTYILHSTT